MILVHDEILSVEINKEKMSEKDNKFSSWDMYEKVW
jgi:hypothetical protein